MVKLQNLSGYINQMIVALRGCFEVLGSREIVDVAEKAVAAYKYFPLGEPG
jgi:hypothetical protein